MSKAIMFGIVLHILNFGRTKCNVLADIFEVSTRTILRYIDDISSIGVPITSFYGKSGGYEIDKNFKLEHNYLTHNEKEILLSFLKNKDDLEYKLLYEKIMYMNDLTTIS